MCILSDTSSVAIITGQISRLHTGGCGAQGFRFWPELVLWAPDESLPVSDQPHCGLSPSSHPKVVRGRRSKVKSFIITKDFQAGNHMYTTGTGRAKEDLQRWRNNRDGNSLIAVEEPQSVSCVLANSDILTSLTQGHWLDQWSYFGVEPHNYPTNSRWGSVEEIHRNYTGWTGSHYRLPNCDLHSIQGDAIEYLFFCSTKNRKVRWK